MIIDNTTIDGYYRRVSNGNFNVYVTYNGIRYRFCTVGLETDAEKIVKAINCNELDHAKFKRRMLAAIDGMIPKRVLRIFDLKNLVFAPYI